MPAMASWSLSDSVPAVHTYSVVTTSGTSAKWANRASITPSGWETLEISVDAPAGGRSAYKVQVKGNNPVEATVSGVTTVVRNSSFDIRLNFGPDSTSTERLNDLAKLADLFAEANFKTAVQNLEPFY